MTYTNRMQEMREAQAITQQAIAAQTGIPQSALSMIERGLEIPNVYYAIAIADCLGADVKEVFPLIRNPWGTRRKRNVQTDSTPAIQGMERE